MHSTSSSSDNFAELVLKRIDEFDKKLSRLIKEREDKSKLLERSEVSITKGQINRAQNVIEQWLAELSGEVIAELAFIDKTTFGYLDCIPKMCGIRIITSNPKDFEKNQIRAERCSRDRPHFEITKINKVHQRWIGSKDSFFIVIGTDLKTDALGRSTHIIRRFQPDLFEESISHFELFWNQSPSVLKEKFGNDLIKLKIYPK